MNEQKSNIKSIIYVILFTLCAVFLIAASIVFANMFLGDLLFPKEPVEQTAMEIEEETMDTKGASLASVVQEIDGRTIAVRKELPIEQPLLLPSEAKDISITVNKSERVLLLYSGEELIAKYSIGLGGSPEGAKEKEGDQRTPEGEYEVCVLNGQSKYYLALGLNYPNREDAARGLASGLITQEQYNDIIHDLDAGMTPNWYTNLGGMIMIHGQKGNFGGQADWTTGCIGVDNQVMDILWQYCKVGTPVTFLP